jgi:hypothetical protein
VLVGAESIGRIVARAGVRPGDLGVLEPGGEMPPTSRVRRLTPTVLPGDWTVERLGPGIGGWFSVMRVHELGTRIEARHLVNPGLVAARVALDTHGGLHEDGSPDAWGSLPSLLPLRAIGDTVLSLLWRKGDGQARLVHLPPTDAFARYTNGVEECGLSAAVLPGGRQVVVQSAKLGGSFAVWDAVTGGIAVEVEVPASHPIVFTSALSSSWTLWAASADTLFEFDPASWAVRFSARLHREPTGSFVGWLSSAEEGETVLIGWNRRHPTGTGYAAPGAGEVLALGTGSHSVERLGSVSSWTSHAVLRRPHGDLIAESWGDEQVFWQVAVQPTPHPLFPPHSAGDWDWR